MPPPNLNLPPPLAIIIDNSFISMNVTFKNSHYSSIKGDKGYDGGPAQQCSIITTKFVLLTFVVT